MPAEKYRQQAQVESFLEFYFLAGRRRETKERSVSWGRRGVEETAVDGDFFELTGEQEKMIRSVQQQIEECVPDLDERIRQQEEALEQATQEQTM